MSRSFHGWLIIGVAALGTVIGMLTIVVSPALAGDHALLANTIEGGIAIGPTATATATATAVPGGTTAIATPYLSTGLFINFLVILLTFGLLLVVGILSYVYIIQRKYYTTALSLSQMGVGVKAVSISAFVAPSNKAELTEAPSQTDHLNVDGLGILAVGTSSEFTAKVEPNASLAKDATWSIAPDGAASMNLKKGEKREKVTVTPQKAGPFVVTAIIEGSPPLQSSASVSAVAPQATSEDLPFMGQGYGSLLIAVLVIVAVILLALTGVLTGEAVATLFGGLLGYIFGVTTSAGTTASKKTDGK